MDFVFDLPEDFATDESFVNYCFQSNATDVRFWEKWLNEHPDKKEVAEEARDLVFLMSIRLEPELLEREYEKIQINQAESPTQPLSGVKKYRNTLWVSGLSFLLLLGIIIGWPHFKNNKTHYAAKSVSSTVEYATAAAQSRSITLSDGTQIVLNAASNLTIDHDFTSASVREVTLSGEAYFNVAKNAAKPFIIHTQTMDITVLGTSFNVKDYPTDGKGETALINGSIRVSLHRDSSRSIILKPNEKITVYKKAAALKQLPIIKNKKTSSEITSESFQIAPMRRDPMLDSGTVSTSWMEGKLVFRNETFDELARQMERKYDVQFNFSDDTLKTFRFTGIFSTETMSEALHALQLASPSNPFNYRMDGRNVYISKGN